MSVDTASFATLLLVAALAADAWFLHGGRRGDTRPRYRRWLARAPLAMLLPTLVALALLGRLDALWTLPPEFAPARALLPAIAPRDVIVGSLAGSLLGLVVVAVRARFTGPRGAIDRLIPVGRDERRLAPLVAVAAGLVEEPFHRLLIPLLVALATGSAAAGFALSTLLFALAHRYQGGWRMLAAGSFGAALAAFYLLSGALWLVVLVHALVNLGPMLVWPLLRDVSSSAASRSGRSSRSTAGTPPGTPPSPPG